MSQSVSSFSIFKNNKKEKDTHPDYLLSAKVQKDNVEEYKEIGSAYIKETKTGQKFFSCHLAKPREFAGKQYTGYVIVDAERFSKMEKIYEDYLIKLREPNYPTPTDLEIDLDKTLNISPEDLDQWEKDNM